MTVTRNLRIARLRVESVGRVDAIGVGGIDSIVY